MLTLENIPCRIIANNVMGLGIVKKRSLLLLSLVISIALLFSSCLPALLLLDNYASSSANEEVFFEEISSVRSSENSSIAASSISTSSLSSSTEIVSSEVPSSSAVSSSKAASSKASSAPKVQSSTVVQNDNTYAAQAEYSDEIVYVTETGAKYHCLGCQYLSKSCIDIYLSEAVGQGYTPCSVCEPTGYEGQYVSQAEQSENKSITVYITKTGAKYHRSGCRYLKKSKISISLDNARAQGYGACSVCDP